jgi:hypothetical protein
MQPFLRFLVWLMMTFGFTSMFYFVSLPAHVPFILTAAVIIGFAICSFLWFRKHIPVVEEYTSGTDTTRAYIIFFCGLAYLVYKGYQLETEYGYWDAWWLWDHHAKYLQDASYWRELFKLDDPYHPDYPLYVSSLIAFGWRLTGTFSMLVPYSFSALVALVFPCALFLSLYKRSLAVASMAFLLLIFNESFARQAFNQYADQPLGLLLFCAIYCLRYARQNLQIIVVIGGLLGCCIWMKNEGLLLSLVFLLFNYRVLLREGRWRRFAAGIVFPICVYAFLKLNAPANDLAKSLGHETLRRLSDWSRYEIVFSNLVSLFEAQGPGLLMCFLFYAVYLYVARLRPGSEILMLFTCLLGFCLVYIISPHDLVWHLKTSLDRLVFQLLPALIFVIARDLSTVRLSVARQ